MSHEARKANHNSESFIGIIPAAGQGARLGSLRSPKELVPIAFLADLPSGELRPMVVAEYSLRAFRDANVRKCIVVVNDRKPEILRYFGNGSDFGLSIAYVNQPSAQGLASAIDNAFEWTGDLNVCVALPDSVFTPRNSVAIVNQSLISLGVDAVLGVFPTSVPEQLAPVRIGDGGRVIEVIDKPSQSAIRNTWGIAAWRANFSRFLHLEVIQSSHISLSKVFEDAIHQGLDIRAVHFELGSYTDIGTAENLAAMIFKKPQDLDDPQEISVFGTRHISMG